MSPLEKSIKSIRNQIKNYNSDTINNNEDSYIIKGVSSDILVLVIIGILSVFFLGYYKYKNMVKDSTLNNSIYDTNFGDKSPTINDTECSPANNPPASFPPIRKKSNASLDPITWLGSVDESKLYSLNSTISDGSTKQLTLPMNQRELNPNFSHMKVGHWSDMGRRPYQEDRYNITKIGTLKDRTPISFYGVFDGHGGSEAAQYCADRLNLYLQNSTSFPDGDIALALNKTFLDVDEDFIATGKPDGATSCVCVVVGNEKIICANAGDSRAIIVKRDGSTVAMSVDHKPGLPSETKRITDLGGRVVYWGRWRVESVLAVSRAIGDAALMPYITAEPDIREHEVVAGEDLFLVVASDGIWDVMQNADVAKFIIEETCTTDDNNGGSGNKVVDLELLKWVGRKLCVEAGRLGSGDNTSVVVVVLNS